MTAKVVEVKAESPKGIRAKLVAMSNDLGWIAKDKTNSAQGYKFTSAESVLGEVRTVAARYGVDVDASVVEHACREGGKTKNGAPIFFHVVKIAWTYTDAETGEQAGPINSVGEGQDSSDKGVYKAITGAMKYGLRLKFLIPMGDEPQVEDDEEDEEPKARNSSNGDARAALQARAGQVPITDRLRSITERFVVYGYESQEARREKAKEILGHPLNPGSEGDVAKLEAWLNESANGNINGAKETLGAEAH